MTGRPSAADSGPAPRKGLLRSRLRDARIRGKLGLILIVPLIAVLVLAALRLVDSGQQAFSAEQVRSLAEVSAQLSTVSHQLHGERMAAARLLSDPDAEPGAYNAAAVTTDRAIEEFRTVRAEAGDVPDSIDSRLARIDEQVEALGTIREEILGEAEVSVPAAVVRYGVILDDIIDYQEAVGQVAGDFALAESIRAVAAFSKAKLHIAESQAVAYQGLLDGSLDEESLTAFLATQTGQQEALLAFTLIASPEQLALVNAGLTGDAVVAAERAAAEVVRSVGTDPRITADRADRAFGAVNNLVTYTERELHADQVQLATQLRDEVFQQVLIESVAVLLTLLIAVAVAVLLARMLARSLRQLRENALAVAERGLPETVERLSDPRTLGENTPEQLAASVREPIQLRSRDEIGEVAQAFNVVHRAAVRVAAEQAALRTSVSAMFLSLARRSQSLVDRMISQLDEIERNEEDPKRLAKMFALDHLATRMRRNDENLLVLAGADSSPPRTDDALVVDLLRASQSEVEHYDRIEFGTVDADVSVVANAVNDVVRLVAELFDNATRFSPPDSAVVCEARRLGDHMIIQIEDRGVGMPQDQVNRLNAWLATPPSLEVTTFRKMGLAVVARLASRHQIRVELRCDPNYGTIAYVALPRPVLVLPRSRTRGMEIPAPRSPLPVEQAPAAPPTPSRQVGQLPRRSPGVAHHAASWRNSRSDSGEPTGGNGQPSHYQPPSPQANSEPSQFDLPVAGRPLYDLTGQQDAAPPAQPAPAQSTAQPAAAQPPYPEATVELPIFNQMEQVWFRNQPDNGPSPASAWEASRQGGVPSAGTYPYPTAAAGSAASGYGPPAPAAQPEPAPAAPASQYRPTTQESQPGNWRTAADFGWRAAAAASQPTSGGATASGLPKRVPQAQLVPGSVDTPGAAPSPGPDPTGRRSPEEIRGLLSAYHRGVQRGRESGGR